MTVNSFDYYQSEARADRREKRQRHEDRVTPLPNRRTAKSVPEDQQIDLAGNWKPRDGSWPVAAIHAERHKPGVYIWGHATVEQLVELRDALASHISEVLEEHGD